jgi:hypothetical protein
MFDETHKEHTSKNHHKLVTLYSITYAINIINIVGVLNMVPEEFMDCINPAVRHAHHTPIYRA